MTHQESPNETSKGFSAPHIPLPNLHLHGLASIQGITRILTSGFGTTAPTSLPTLKTLLQQTAKLNAERRPQGSPLTILPGSGINPNTIRTVLAELLPVGLMEVHLSAGGWVDSVVTGEFRKEGMNMGEWGVWRTREDVVRRVREIVDFEAERFFRGAAA